MQPTPPAYMKGSQTHRRAQERSVLDSASQFKPPTSKIFYEKGTAFHTELMDFIQTYQYNYKKKEMTPRSYCSILGLQPLQ
jgi:hypothetical protein